MIGTSVVALPWAFNQSGLAMGVFIILFINAIAMFTALTILKLHSKHSKCLLKSRYCQKATKFDETSHLFLSLLSNVKRSGRFSKFLWPFQKTD